MDQAKARVLCFTPEPERICAAAARLSTTEGSAEEIYRNTEKSNIRGLIRNVMGLGHQSVAEHASFSIAFENVSVFFEQFLIEFRLAAYTVKSRRYVNYENMGWLVPDFRFEDKKNPPEILNRYNDLMAFLFASYTKLTDMGIPKEDARFILPYCFRSHIYCTMNARELLHFLKQAIQGRGRRYPEIRKVALSLWSDVKEIFPDVFEGLDPEALLPLGREKILSDLPPLLDENLGEDVSLLASTPDAGNLVAESFLMGEGYGPAAAKTLLEKDPTLKAKLLQTILHDTRPRELEQVNYTFHIPKISLAGLTHLARHRIQGLMVPDFARFGKRGKLVMPESVAGNAEALALYLEAEKKANALYVEFKSLGLVPEDSVYLMLAGNTLDVLTTMNARQLYHFLRLRTCYRAQWEIRDIALKMRKALISKDMDLFSASGPSCYFYGKCTEGRMSCGRMKEIKEELETQV